MKGILKISVMALLVFILLLGACTKPAPTTPTPAPTTPTPAPTTPTPAPTTPTPAPTTPTPAAGPEGEIIMAVPTLGSETFGPYQQFGVSLTELVYDGLIRTNHIDDPSEPVGIYPDIAERWEISDDFMTYDFFIRKGVQFHNGWGELTAEDMVFSLDLLKDPENQSGGNWYFAPPEEGGWIASYEVVDKYQFRIHVSVIHTLTLDEFMDSYYRVYCKKYVETVGKEEAFKEPIGTGNWKWVETVPGDHITFEANEDSWDKVPEFKYFTLKLVPDESTRVFMLQSGQVNVTFISPDKIPEVQAAGLNIIQIPERKPIEVFFGGQHLPDNKFYDPTLPWADHPDEPEDSEWNQRALKVRKALSLGINYQAMIDNIMHGYATPYVMHDITMSHAWYKPEWKPIPYDPVQAKALLAEAGYANGFDKTVQVIIPSTPLPSVNTRAIAEAVANDIEALGIKIERVVMEQNLIDEMWMFGFDSCWKIRLGVGWVIIHPSSGWIWSRASWAPLDEVGQRTKWDEFCERSQAAKTDAELKQITEEAYDWAYTTYESRGLFVAPFLMAVGSEIKGYSKNPLFYESQGQYNYSFEYLEHAD